MRDSAVRVVPSAMPNSSPDFTRTRAESTGGCMPSSVEATTDRAERGLRSGITCPATVILEPVAATMLPPKELLPEDVLPTERLSATGRPAPELREELRRIPNARNAVTVAGAYIQSFG